MINNPLIICVIALEHRVTRGQSAGLGYQPGRAATILDFNHPDVGIGFQSPLQNGIDCRLISSPACFVDPAALARFIMGGAWGRPKQVQAAIEMVDNDEDGTGLFGTLADDGPIMPLDLPAPEKGADPYSRFEAHGAG